MCVCILYRERTCIYNLTVVQYIFSRIKYILKLVNIHPALRINTSIFDNTLVVLAFNAAAPAVVVVAAAFVVVVIIINVVVRPTDKQRFMSAYCFLFSISTLLLIVDCLRLVVCAQYRPCLCTLWPSLFFINHI